MKLKKLLLAGLLGMALAIGNLGNIYAQTISYQVQSGDTYWSISQKYGISLPRLIEINNANGNSKLYVGQSLLVETSNTQAHRVQAGETYWIISQKYGVDITQLMAINNATQRTTLNIGDQIIIPSPKQEIKETFYTVQSGDTYWIISQKFNINITKLMEYNGHNQNTVLYIGQIIKIPQSLSTTNNTSSNTLPSKTSSEKPYVTHTNYTVQKGDTIWSLANKSGIPQEELAKTNNITTNTVLNIGDSIKIPVHHVPVKTTPTGPYGEYLDWWTEAQYVLPVGAEFKIIDFYTGKSFMAKRTTGSNHADVETLTIADTNKMIEIWGGSFTWAKRPIIIEYKGRRLAASAAGMPHAGNDGAPGGLHTSWRSDNYGARYNFDWVKNNAMNGVFDIHFLNSTTHKDDRIDDTHQHNISITAGYLQ